MTALDATRPAAAGPADAQAILAALDQSPAFVCMLRGPAHVFTYANGNYARLTGDRPLLGRSVRDALPEIATQDFCATLDEVWGTGKPFVGKAMPVALEGVGGRQTRHLDVVYEPMRDTYGAVEGILVHGVDVTDEVRARLLVEQQYRRFDALLSSVADFVYIFDRDGRFQYVNRALLDLWGLTAAQAIGRNFHELGYPAALAERLQHQIAGVVATAGRVVDETPYTSPVTGATEHYEYIFVPIFGADGVTVEAVAGTTRDISARKRDELARASAHAEAQKAVKLKDEFLATLSHELRTPMSAIMGWAQVLARRGHGDATERKAVDAILRNARSQAQLIEDIVDLSRIEAGRVRLALQAVDVQQVARIAAESLAPLAEAKPVAIDIPEIAGSTLVTADPDRLQQVLWNLISNAIKFTTPDGRVAVRIRRDGGEVVVEVADDGIGIRADFLPHVFDRFRQGDGSHTRRAGGLGIGLAIARQLVELQGGTIAAQSAGAGQGATFTVRLPARDDATSPRDPVPPVLEAGSLAGLCVLVVDDEADIRQLLRHVIEEAGGLPLVADGPAAALDVARRRRPDLVLCDIQMPQRDGYEFLRAFRQLPGGDAPAIAFSALARPDDRERALAAGYRAFLSKPMLPAQIVGAIVAAVRGT